MLKKTSINSNIFKASEFKTKIVKIGQNCSKNCSQSEIDKQNRLISGRIAVKFGSCINVILPSLSSDFEPSRLTEVGNMGLNFVCFFHTNFEFSPFIVSIRF